MNGNGGSCDCSCDMACDAGADCEFWDLEFVVVCLAGCDVAYSGYSEC